mmetsp:Transcript_83455/g.263578  ORF Transcript_83455/g.263578 Transcript_83455/m.263578 type:complete len:282 (+) Transcript_83455:629-1474(+)
MPIGGASGGWHRGGGGCGAAGRRGPSGHRGAAEVLRRVSVPHADRRASGAAGARGGRRRNGQACGRAPEDRPGPGAHRRRARREGHPRGVVSGFADRSGCGRCRLRRLQPLCTLACEFPAGRGAAAPLLQPPAHGPPSTPGPAAGLQGALAGGRQRGAVPIRPRAELHPVRVRPARAERRAPPMGPGTHGERHRSERGRQGRRGGRAALRPRPRGQPRAARAGAQGLPQGLHPARGEPGRGLRAPLRRARLPRPGRQGGRRAWYLRCLAGALVECWRAGGL